MKLKKKVKLSFKFTLNKEDERVFYFLLNSFSSKDLSKEGNLFFLKQKNTITLEIREDFSLDDNLDSTKYILEIFQVFKDIP